MKKYTMHVISGTHWDREWRHTAEQSKLRLCDLMDEILCVLENNSEYKFFCVDGGMIVIEDYLSVRPENRERIKNLIKSGKMSVVKWYTLPETNTVAPESMVRNLMLGKKMSDEFGGGMKSGYTATSYGQNSQMPQLYQNFGIDTAIFYRGTNKHVLTPLFDWEGKDGSILKTLRTFDEVTRTNWFFYIHGPAVLGKGQKDLTYTFDRMQIPVHMIDSGSYEKAFFLLKENDAFIDNDDVLKKALDGLLKQVMPYKIGRHLLALNMEDNDEPYNRLPELIKRLNDISEEVEIVQDTLDSYMQAIINDETREKPAHHFGELRYTTMEYDNFNALLGATHSSRIKIKLKNEDAETNLIHLGEPLAAIATAYGKEYPKTMLERAWQALLKNHAHDSICGAAVDLAHEDMMFNFSLAKTVAEEVTNRSVISLLSNINTQSAFLAQDNVITIFNTLPYARKEILPIIIDTPEGVSKKADIGVDGAASGEEFYDIVDEKGNVIPYVQLSEDKSSIGVERSLDTKSIKFNAKRRRILIEVEVPPLGYASYAMRFRPPVLSYHPQLMPDRKLIARENGVLENEHLKVVIKPNATFDILDKSTGKKFENIGFLSDSGEVGSAHISVQPKRNPIYTSLGSVADIVMTESNLLRGSFSISFNLEIPAAADNSGEERRRDKSIIPVEYILTLEKNSKVLKFDIKLKNQARDHKLCVHIPTGIYDAKKVSVESAWAVEERDINWREHKDNFESFPAFQPMQNFIDVSNGETGLAVLNKGLREYEICDDIDRTIKITLIRTQRAYMTANSKMITEELDKYTGQHSFGDFIYHLAICPHEGKWDDAKIMQSAYKFKVPLKAIQSVPQNLGAGLPASGSYFNVTPSDKIMISALKRSEDGKGTIIRLCNISDEAIDFTLSTILPVSKAIRLKMDETFVEELKVTDKKISFKMEHNKIETIYLKD